MGYQPNVVNKGDIIVINNVEFKVMNDFNLQRNKGLKLSLNDDPKPRKYIAKIIMENEVENVR